MRLNFRCTVSEPLGAPAQLLGAFTTVWEESKHHGGRMVAVAAHSWMSGQANRIVALKRALEVMRSHSGVWSTTYAEALQCFRAQEQA